MKLKYFSLSSFGKGAVDFARTTSGSMSDAEMLIHLLELELENLKSVPKASK